MLYRIIKSAVKMATIPMLLLVLTQACAESAKTWREFPKLQADFLAALQTIDPQEPYDFHSQSTHNGWGYFYSEDRRSIFRIHEGMEEPEVFLEDSDALSFVSEGRLYYMQDSMLMARDLENGSIQELIKIYSGSRSDLSLFDQFIICSHYGPLTVQYISGGRDTTLILGDHDVHELLWCDGSTLYFTTYDDLQFWLMKWDFVNDPVPVYVPAVFPPVEDYYKEQGLTDYQREWAAFYGYTDDEYYDRYYHICAHEGNTLYFDSYDGQTLAVMTLPDETVTCLNADPAYTRHSDTLVYAEAAARGDFTIPEKSPQDKIQDPSILPINLFTGSPYNCDHLLYLDDEFAVCQWMDYHSDYGPGHGKYLSCKDADYMHYYIRTELVRLSDGHIIWRSGGNHYTMDY